MMCEFCETMTEIEKRTIGTNDLARAFLTQTPITRGHFLVIPQRCVPCFRNLDEKEIHAIFLLMEQMKDVLSKKYGYKNFNHAWNQGVDAGQTVGHFHLHVVPRKVGDQGVQKYEPRAFLYRPGERDVVESEELYRFAQQVRNL